MQFTYRTAIQLLLPALLMPLCAGCLPATQLETAWKDPSVGPLSFKKLAIVVLNSTAGERRAQEDQIVSMIKKTQAVPSYTFIPDNILTKRDEVKSRIIQGGFDGAAIIRLVDSSKQTTYVPGTTSYWNDVYAYGPYRYDPGYYVTDTIVRAELSLYAVPSGKLLWVGSSVTSNPANAKDLATQMANAAAAELRKQGLLE